MKTSLNRIAICAALLAATLFRCGVAPAAESKGLDKQLLVQADKILKVLNEKGYKTVGILKFRVKKGAEPISDSVGTLNSMLADQLEVALVLKDAPVGPNQVGIIHHASSVAASLKGANHLTVDGRKKLFEGKYPLAWGNTEVTPDVLITGVVQVTTDLKEMSIGLLMFDKDGSEFQKVVPNFTAKVDAAMLVELGESFAMRGGFDSGKVETTESEKVKKYEKDESAAIETAVKVKAKEASFPLNDTNVAAISLDILYDGKPISIEFKDGKASVLEPKTGQKVTLIIKRNKPDGKRYGVVLKVNGENTLQREKSRDIDCRKWIIDPDRKQTVVEGYQIDTTKHETFKVLSLAESKKNEVNYGDDTGLISMTVFAEQKGSPLTPPLGDEDPADLVAVNRGIYPKDSLAVANLGILKTRFADFTPKGLLGAGAVEAHATTLVTFVANPTPIESTIIRYYNKQTGTAGGFPNDLPDALDIGK